MPPNKKETSKVLKDIKKKKKPRAVKKKAAVNT